MSAFSQQKLLKATTAQIPEMAEAIRQEFLKDNFEVHIDPLTNGGCDISLSKGGNFKAVLGMRSALKVTLSPQLDGVCFDAHVGIFGQQFLPSVISMFFYWPVLITQIWGMVKQSKLDDRALAAAESVISPFHAMQLTGGTTSAQLPSGETKYCTKCGTPAPLDSVFCSKCGNKF